MVPYGFAIIAKQLQRDNNIVTNITYCFTLQVIFYLFLIKICVTSNFNTILVIHIFCSLLLVMYFSVWLKVRVMVFSTTFNNISAISWRSVLFVKETGVPRENHRPVVSLWQTLSHNVVSITPRMSEIRTHNVSGDSYWLHR